MLETNLQCSMAHVMCLWMTIRLIAQNEIFGDSVRLQIRYVNWQRKDGLKMMNNQMVLS